MSCALRIATSASTPLNQDPCGRPFSVRPNTISTGSCEDFLLSSGFAGSGALLAAAAGTTLPFLPSPLSLAGVFGGSAGFDDGGLLAGGCAPSARLRPSETTKG